MSNDLFGEPCDADDPYNVLLWDVDNPVVVRDTGGSIPRTLREWIDTMLSDAESVGADVSKVRAWLDVYDYDVAHADADDPDEPLEDYAREIDDDITEAILATGQYVAVADGDSQSWVIYKRKVEGQA